MKTIFKFASAIALSGLLLSFNLYLMADLKPIDEKVKIRFSGSDGAGTFGGLKASIKFDSTDLPNSTISASIDVKTINTGVGGKNKHALSADFLEAEKFPTINFVSKSIAKTATGFEAIGDLTLKGVTKEVKLPFTYTPDATGGVFNGTLTIIRGEFGVTKNLKAETKIELEVPVTKN